MTETRSCLPSNFIRNIIAEDLKSIHTTVGWSPGFHRNRTVICISAMRNRFVSISVWLTNQRGTCHLRFDDTNPSKEDVEYIDSIKEDVRWLGFDWGERLYYASDYL